MNDQPTSLGSNLSNLGDFLTALGGAIEALEWNYPTSPYDSKVKINHATRTAEFDVPPELNADALRLALNTICGADRVTIGQNSGMIVLE